jgi:hypothetical protein
VPAESDFAIVVGIDRYPFLPQSLEGAERDAQAFASWVVSPTGGGVPVENVTLVLSSAYTGPEPTEQHADEAFRRLYVLAQERGGYLGRRLYVFLAGHGIAQDLNEASLLTANVRDSVFDFHIPGRRYAEWFRAAAYFDEVVLFTDCCRSHFPRTPVKAFPYPAEFNSAAQQVRWLYGFATKWSQSALEAAAGAFTRGIFTTALLEGLKGAADAKGQITAQSLKEFVLNHPTLLEHKTDQEPSIVFEGDILFGVRAPTDYPVHFALRTPGASAPIRVLDGGLRELGGLALVEHGPTAFETRLPRGLYVAQARGGAETFFQVTGATARPGEPQGTVHVDL